MSKFVIKQARTIVNSTVPIVKAKNTMRALGSVPALKEKKPNSRIFFFEFINILFHNLSKKIFALMLLYLFQKAACF